MPALPCWLQYALAPTYARIHEGKWLEDEQSYHVIEHKQL